MFVMFATFGFIQHKSNTLNGVAGKGEEHGDSYTPTLTQEIAGNVCIVASVALSVPST